MSDEGNVADDAASDGGETEDSGSGGRTAVVTKAATRPQRPSGKRSRQRVADTSDTEEDVDGTASSTEVEDSLPSAPSSVSAARCRDRLPVGRCGRATGFVTTAVRPPLSSVSPPLPAAASATSPSSLTACSFIR